MISKNIRRVMAGLLIAAVVAPALAFAQTPRTATGTSSPRAQVSCDRIPEITNRVQAKITEHRGEISAKRIELVTNRVAKRSDQQARIEEQRGVWNKNRDAQYAKLLEKATTTEQKAAVAQFKADMDVAIAA